MPASAADMQFREDIGTGVSIDEEVQEDFLSPGHPELSDEAAAPVIDTGNGGTVLVMPRSDLDEPVSMDQNEVVEDAVTVECEEVDEEEPVDEEDEEVVEVDKSELEAAIEAAGELDEADYTEESWGVFASAVAAAEAVMADEEATQEEVDNAFAELNSAVDALEEVVEEGDKSELEEAIAAAGELDEADYTEKSWSKLEKALAAAQTVMEDDQATQKMVDKALAKLNKAMDALEEIEEEEEKSIQIEVYKELLEAFEKMQNTYNRLLDMFDSIFGK
jgi:tetratricopeptide (TPR) repeat protein